MNISRVLIRLVIVLIVVLSTVWLLLPRQDPRILQVGKYHCLDKNTNGICDFQEKQISGPVSYEISHQPEELTFDVLSEPSSTQILRQIQKDATSHHKFTEPYFREIEEKILEDQKNRQNLYRTSGGEIIYAGGWNWDEN